MTHMIGMVVSIAHWCVSCASDGSVVPSGVGLLGGAAAAAGGVASQTPMNQLYPPGTTANPDGSLSWPNPDGTTSTKNADGTVTTTSPGGSTTTTLPGGGSVTTGTDGTRTVKDPDGFSATTNPDGTQTTQSPDGSTTSGRVDGPEAPDPPDPLDPFGNAILGGLASGGLEGAGEGVVNPLLTAAKGAVKDTLQEGVKATFNTGSPEDVEKMSQEADEQNRLADAGAGDGG